jgi:carbon monoxide dehydrogenase subunit G
LRINKELSYDDQMQSKPKLALTTILIALLLSTSLNLRAQNTLTTDEYKSYRNGDKIAVQVNLHIKATKDIIWAVITDYGNATKFISSLQSSTNTIISSQEQMINQVGKVDVGPFSLNVHTNYKVILNSAQYKIDGNLISGDLKYMKMGTQLLDGNNGTTLLKYFVEAEPSALIPNFIAEEFLLKQAKTSFKDLITEIYRRSNSN